jgi:two-component system, sensor histidine kinase and response regulator
MTRPTLLVVDDEVINIDILIEALGDDYAVRVATDGAAALQSVAKALPDLILLDVMMPGMDGFEVCRRLKDDSSTREIPIIFLTALNETADKVKGFSVGSVDYVTKPFQLEEIHARVEAHLELRRRRHELQQSYDRLRELEALRDSLVHMIVHDMRSPLSVILGNLELAQIQPLPQTVAEFIDNALQNTETLLTMISTLLDISKMEAGQMTLEYSSVDLEALTGEVIRMVAPLKGRRRLAIALREKMEPLRCDAELIRRVLQNLIVNAIKFTDEKTGVVTLLLESGADGKVHLSVVDNGQGIPLEYRERVFDKFCQVMARKEGNRYSTGLGLTFCKLAVEAHGGRIGLDSEVGKGSVFRFELPRR